MRIFKEEQRFTQSWLIVLIIISVLTPTGIILNEYTKENSTMSQTEFVLIIGILVICIAPIFFFKLITRIDEGGIHYRFFPIHRNTKTIKWSEIKSIRLRKYDAISEYGGWGVKGFFGQRGKAFNVKGNIGIQLEFDNSKSFLIGTQKKEEVKRILETYRHKVASEA